MGNYSFGVTTQSEGYNLYDKQSRDKFFKLHQAEDENHPRYSGEFWAEENELHQQMLKKYSTPSIQQNPIVGENTMNDYDGEYLIENADREVTNEMNKRLAERLLKAKMDMVDALGEDIFEDGNVITFSKKFGDGEATYQYAALKVGNNWYITSSRNTKVFSWEKLVAFLVSGKFPTTSYTKMVAATA